MLVADKKDYRRGYKNTINYIKDWEKGIPT